MTSELEVRPSKSSSTVELRPVEPMTEVQVLALTPPTTGSSLPTEGLKRKRGRPPGSTNKQKRVTPLVEQHVAAMIAAGTSQRQVSTALKLPRDAVATIAAKPTTQELVVALRETIRNSTLYGLQAATEGAYDFLAGTIQSRDAKSFQLVANGLANMERTAASASGESRRVDATLTGQLDTNVTAEAKAILAAFLGVIPSEEQG